MNTESVTCRKIYPLEKVGDFCFDRDFEHIYVWLPGMKGPDSLRIQKGPPGGPRVWGWDGNEEKPTIQPSIHAVGDWHGFLQAGELKSC